MGSLTVVNETDFELTTQTCDYFLESSFSGENYTFKLLYIYFSKAEAASSSGISCILNFAVGANSKCY